MSGIVIPGRPRTVHPLFARAVHEAIRDTMLTYCPSMRAMAVPMQLIVRHEIARSRHRRRFESE